MKPEAIVKVDALLKPEILFSNILNLLIIGFVIHMALSGILSITAINMNKNRLTVKTTIEAVTFLISFFICFLIEPLRIFKNCGITVIPVVDFIVSSLFLMSSVAMFKGISARLKSED